MQQRRKSTPVEVKTPIEDLNQFLDLREEANSIDALIETLKSRVLDIVPEGRSRVTLEGNRKNERGRFNVTAVTRDLREFDEEKTVELLKEKIDNATGTAESLHDVLVTKITFDHDKLAALIERGVVTKAELRRILTGRISTFPKVTFKPDFDDEDDS